MVPAGNAGTVEEDEMHPYISQAVIAQQIEDALTRAEADRRYAVARATRRDARIANHANHAHHTHHGLTRWIVRNA
jgi:hypothetical protein